MLQTFTAMQQAIMMVQAYPHTADVVAIMNCLAEDYNEPCADVLMDSHVTCPVKLDASALKVPSPDLLLELVSWSQSNHIKQPACRPVLMAK